MKPSKIESLAPVSEIFFSFQGEGIDLLRPQIFVRFSGCNLSCSYCDTPDNVSHRKLMSVLDVISSIKKLSFILNSKIKPEISLTGGEPLLHKRFLEKLIPLLKKSGHKVYLETNGTKPDALTNIIDFIDTVSMDIKLPSASSRYLWKEHEAFLRLARHKVFVKIVVGSKTKYAEIKKAFKLISKISREIPLILQPETGSGNKVYDNLEKWLVFARKKLKKVCIVRQLHKKMGIR